MDVQIKKKMDININDSINHNLENSAVVALTLLGSGVLDNMKAIEVEDPNPSSPQCASTFSQTTAEQIIDATLLGFNCHTVTPGSSPNNNTFMKPQFATTVRREVTVVGCAYLSPA